MEMALTSPGWRWKSPHRTETPTSATQNTTGRPNRSQCSGMRQREQKLKAKQWLGRSKLPSLPDVNVRSQRHQQGLPWAAVQQPARTRGTGAGPEDLDTKH